MDIKQKTPYQKIWGLQLNDLINPALTRLGHCRIRLFQRLM